MNDRTKDELFAEAPQPMLYLKYRGWDDQLVAFVATGRQMITIDEADLSVDQARQLRDWLNTVIP